MTKTLITLSVLVVLTSTILLAASSYADPVDSTSADVNGDACVDRTDFRLVFRAFFKGPPDLTFDVNDDGKVNFRDLRKVYRSFTNPRGTACDLRLPNVSWNPSTLEVSVAEGEMEEVAVQLTSDRSFKVGELKSEGSGSSLISFHNEQLLDTEAHVSREISFNVDSSNAVSGEYEAEVSLTINGSELSTYLLIRIRVIDEQENWPMVTSDSYQISHPEQLTSFVLAVVGNDPTDPGLLERTFLSDPREWGGEIQISVYSIDTDSITDWLGEHRPYRFGPDVVVAGVELCGVQGISQVSAESSVAGSYFIFDEKLFAFEWFRYSLSNERAIEFDSIVSSVECF